MRVDDWNQIQVPTRTRLLTISWLTEDMVAWENRTFSPSEGQPWVRETILPAGELVTANKELTGIGIIQYDYFAPIGSSVSEAKGRAKDIKDAFKAGSAIGGLWIERSEILTGSPGTTSLSEAGSSPWYQIPVHVYYRVFTTNP